MRFQPLTKICSADAGIGDCDENENNGDGGKGRHRLSDWLVLAHPFQGGMPHSDKFEEEVGQASDVKQLRIPESVMPPQNY